MSYITDNNHSPRDSDIDSVVTSTFKAVITNVNTKIIRYSVTY